MPLAVHFILHVHTTEVTQTPLMRYTGIGVIFFSFGIDSVTMRILVLVVDQESKS